MSQFSGKCDFYDIFIDIHSDDDNKKTEENLKKLRLYVGGKDGRSHLVKSDTIKDIAKYYPYLVCMLISDKNGENVMYLSSSSFIDQEERERLSWYVNDVMKYWRKCKRTKIPFIAEECLKKFHYLHADVLSIIIDRVAKDGDKAEFDDIHLPFHEYYRQRWFEELVKVGWTEREAYDWAFNAFFESADKIEKRLGRKLKDEV